MKRLIYLLLALVMSLFISSCTSAPEQTVDDNNTVANTESQIATEEQTETPTSAPTEIQTELPSETKTEAQTETPTSAPTEIQTELPSETKTEAQTEDEDPYPYYPWGMQLPDGIEANVQKNGDFELLIKYKNTTGGNISMITQCDFYDQNGDGINSMTHYAEYIPDGGEYLCIMECDDYFEYNLLYCEVDTVGARIQLANDKLTIDSEKNSDGSIHIDASTTADDGASISGYIVFVNSEGEIMGYEYIGWGFGDSGMEGDTDIPGYDYDDYIVCVYAVA